MKLKTINDSWIRKFKSGDIETFDLTFHPDLNSRVFPMSISKKKLREQLERNHKLCKDNREVLKSHFGDPSFRVRGEFLHNCYVITDGNLTGVIFTAKGKGTSIEIVGGYDEFSKKELIKFFDKYEKLMLDIG